MPIYIIPSQNQEDSRTMDAPRLLRALGVTRKLSGFRYAEYMIDQILEDERKLRLITKCLYPETARYFNVSPQVVEHGLRTLIQNCWQQEDHELLDHIAGKHLKEQPTNTEFLDMVTEFLKNLPNT